MGAAAADIGAWPEETAGHALETQHGWQVLVCVLAFDNERRVLLRTTEADDPEGRGDLSSGPLWGLPCAPARPGEDPDQTARLLAPTLQQPKVPEPRAVPLGGRTDREPTAGLSRLRLVYAVHVPRPPTRPRQDGALWWYLTEAAGLRLTGTTRYALVHGWSHLSL